MMRMKGIILFCLVIGLCAGAAAVAEGAPEWQATVWVQSQGGKLPLVLGADATATDGFDKVWDSYAMLGGQLKPYFARPEWNPNFQTYWRDIRAKAPGVTTDWTFVIESDMPNSTVTLDWDLSAMPADYGIVLSDVTGGVNLDMRAAPSYTFTYVAKRDFKVAISAAAEPPAPKNQAPVANAGPDQIIEVASCGSVAVTLDGSASTDPDGDTLTYFWAWNGGSAQGPTPTVSFPMGTTVATLTVDDGKGATSTDTVNISVNDSVAAAIRVTATPSILRPANHKYVSVTTNVVVNDACVPAMRVELLSVTSNEPDYTAEAGDLPNDIVINPNGTLLLRAERSSYGSGRVYTITYLATDAGNNQTVGTAQVIVPLGKKDSLTAGTAQVNAPLKLSNTRGGLQ
jgi:hypothetical protein